MRKNTLLGVPIEISSKQEIFLLCKEWILESSESGRCRQIATVNPEFLMEARKSQDFLHVLQDVDFRIADGFGLVCASIFLCGFKKKLFRMTGVELTDMLAQLCAETGKKIYLIGADPGVAEKAAKVLQKKFPSLKIAGAEEGILKESTQGSSHVIPSEVRAPVLFKSETIDYKTQSFRALELIQKELRTRISTSGADVLLVAFGAPKQDLWIAENKERLSGVKIAVGVGGTFDYFAGVVPYAPRAMRILGLEWLFRLIIQPHRLNRIITAVVRFPIEVIFEKFRKHSITPANTGIQVDPRIKSEDDIK